LSKQKGVVKPLLWRCLCAKIFNLAEFFYR